MPAYNHEVQGGLMLQELVSQNNIDLTTNEIELIKSLIIGTPLEAEKRWLYQIVSNSLNSVDVDKLDYLMRDPRSVNIHSSIDSRRLLEFTRVVGDEICWDQKEAFNLYELFHVRYSLHKRVYTHRVSVGIEYMILYIMLTSDILKLSDHALKITEAVADLDRFLWLDDSILNSVGRSTQSSLGPARELLKRLNTRDLYRFVDELIIPSNLSEHVNASSITAEKLMQCITPRPLGLKSSDIIVHFVILNYSQASKNPVDSIKFYSKASLLQSPPSTFTISREKVSIFIPLVFKETTVRIYVKNGFGENVQTGFRKLIGILNNLIVAEPKSPVSGFKHQNGLSNPDPDATNAMLQVNDALILSPRKVKCAAYFTDTAHKIADNTKKRRMGQSVFDIDYSLLDNIE